MRTFACSVASCGTAAALAGCSMLSGPATQAVEVRVEAQNPAWADPLECEASNAVGTWPFIAPGTVTVRISSPLWISCKVPPGAVAAQSVTAAKPTEHARAAASRGATAGAVIGGTGGVALAVATAPVAGPAVAMAVAAGSAWRGAEVGGAAASISAEGPLQMYPSPVVIRIVEAVTPTQPVPRSGEDVRPRQRP